MRSLLAMFIALGMSMSTMAEEKFPYEATIQSKSANVRSGPAKVHYVTNQLIQGDKVEVFRHDPGGWYAIRPPQSEFSLVRAKYILLSPNNGTGRVTLDGTRAWVGTRVAAQSEPMWQVQLQRGDVVKVIGKQQVRDANGGSNTWYEIAPPSGEFRWIHESEFQTPALAAQNSESTAEQKPTDLDKLSAQPQTLAVEDQGPEDQLLPTQQQAERNETQAEFRTSNELPELTVTIRPQPFQPTQIDVEPKASRIDEGVRTQPTSATNLLTSNASRLANEDKNSAGWQVAGEERSEGQRQFSNADGPRVFNAGNEAGLSQLRASDSPAAQNASPTLAADSESQADTANAVPSSPAISSLTSANPSPFARIQGESFEDQYRQLELILTKSILKPADQWELDPLHRAVEDFAKGAIDPDQQIMVSALLRKIESFEKLQQQQRAVNSPVVQPDRKSRAAISNTLPDNDIARQDDSSPNSVLPADLNVRPAAFAVNPNGVTQLEQPSETKADQPADEVGEVADGGGAIGTGINAEPDSIYDGTGWLNLLYTNNGKGRSGYVLQDENGNIIKTILPAPGVNLDRYLKQEVGVMGRKGFNRKYNLPHVTADRVILLERHR